MRFGAEARRSVYAAPIALVAIVTFLLIHTMASFEPQMNSGRPRDLINQDPCWTPENPDDISQCELDD
jgi:hypothetical protein